MEVARNPAAMREMMRSQDRQLSNIEVQRGGGGACEKWGCLPEGRNLQVRRTVLGALLSIANGEQATCLCHL